MILNQYATVTELRGDALWLTFSDPGARDTFNHANGEDQVAQALVAELGATLTVRARLESEPIPADGKTSILSVAPSPSPASARSPRPSQPGGVGPDQTSSGTGGRQRSPISRVPTPGPDRSNAPMPPAPEHLEASEGVKPTADVRSSALARPDSTVSEAVGPAEPDLPLSDEPDLPAPDDIIVENPGDEAEDLVMELFGAELVKEETTTRGSG